MLQMILYFCLAVTYTLATGRRWLVACCTATSYLKWPASQAVNQGSSDVLQRGLSVHPSRAALILRMPGVLLDAK